MKIGNVELDSKLILAPMAGVNCAAFRLLCHEYGAGLVSSPMIVVNQIIRNPENLLKSLCFLKEEKPISIQLVGSDSAMAAEAVKIIEQYADIIDINLGCPEKDILALHGGSFMIKHPDQIKKIAKPIIDNTNKPVTAKIRIGWDENSINTLQTVKILEDFGVSAITVHARTTKQKYSGNADWTEIKKAKEIANVPIIGNGDVFKPGTAKAMIEQTGCDLVMIGRGSIGNPFIFRRTNALLKTGKNIEEPTEQEKKECFIKFLRYYKRYEKMRSFSELRQHGMWFTKGISGSKKLRSNLMRTKTVEEILDMYGADKN